MWYLKEVTWCFIQDSIIYEGFPKIQKPWKNSWQKLMQYKRSNIQKGIWLCLYELGLTKSNGHWCCCSLIEYCLSSCTCPAGSIDWGSFRQRKHNRQWNFLIENRTKPNNNENIMLIQSSLWFGWIWSSRLIQAL